MKIAVDAMGGDYAPDEIVKGAVKAAKCIDADLILVGNEKKIRTLCEPGLIGKCISVYHCSEIIYMDEIPARAILKKRYASIKVAFELVRHREADAVISAGNSGAFVTSAVLNLGLVKGIEKPAIASILPGKSGPFILVDSGANADCKAQHLYQFALMGHALAVSYLNIDNPKIGLLSIGEESNKGNRLVKEAYKMLQHSPVNFTGNVEGTVLFDSLVDVVVCDGFVGNVVLKTCEGIAQYIKDLISKEINKCIKDSNLIKRVLRRLDYEEYGGGIVLGVNGLSIICHGRSSSKSIKNAIIMAFHFLKNKIIDKILLELNRINGFLGESYGGI